MTPEERAELECELAAELQELALKDDEEEDEELLHKELKSEYVRLDLATVLQNVSKSPQHTEEKANVGGTWSKLMESVAHCEAVVFGAFALEMEELQTQLLPKMKALATNVSLERRAEALREAEAGQPSLHMVVVEAAIVEPQRASIDTQETPTRQEPSVNAALGEVPLISTGQLHDLTPAMNPTHSVSIAVSGNLTPTVDEASEVVEAPQQAIEQREEIKTQVVDQLSLHAEHESDRLKAQLHAQRAQQELEAMMAAMASQWELEQAQLEFKRREAAMERKSRIAMDKAEKATRLYLEAERVADEVALMQREDALAQCLEALLARALQCQAAERQQMAQEETRTWRLLRHQRDTQRKEKLVEEHSRLRRWHHRVMEELVCSLAATAEAKRRAEDTERRRMQRELSAMQSEEHWMRRVLAQERALGDGTRRQADRLAMELEDTLARRIQNEERQRMETRRERAESAAMESEEQRSRVWETLWRLRIKQLRKWVAGKPRRDTKQSWERWRGVVIEFQQCEQEEEDEKRRHKAARTILGCMAQYTVRRRAVRSREAHEAHTEATQAARVVQSAFRGFHVRRKFQNALEMAKTMEFDGEGEYGEVNLDDLIQAPPELDEDWETPTISEFHQRQTEPTQLSEEEESVEADDEDQEEEDEEDEETVREQGSIPVSVAQARAATPKQNQQTPQLAEGGGNLAAQLWNRMRNKTLKRQHIQEEKKRQQDPEYRAKKILGKASSALSSHTNHQQQQQLSQATTVATTVSWATNSDKKKAPKVKLPSLVERLRKKTAAAR